MAGTTVEDSGLVRQSFLAADSHAGLSKTDADRDEMLRYVSDTMGQSKIVVFRALFGSEELAQRANVAFESAYEGL
ncbi:MAG TPA: haloacid dehalogenase, partial [Mycobacterium sp.]